MFLLGLTSPWGLICCKMSPLRQRQQEREQHSLLDLGERCCGALRAERGLHLCELHQSDQEHVGSTSSQRPEGWTEIFQSSFMAALGFPAWGTLSLFMVLNAQLDLKQMQMEFDAICVPKEVVLHMKKKIKSLLNSKKERLSGLNMFFFQQETWEKGLPSPEEPPESWWQEEHFPL